MSDSPLFQAPAVADDTDELDGVSDVIDNNDVIDDNDGASDVIDNNVAPAAAAPVAAANAPTAESVLAYVTKALVGQPDLVEIASSTDRGAVRFDVTVGPDDAGRVIGRRGRIAGSLRQVVRAVGARDGVDVRVEIVDR